jgi:hypothetical protein
MSKTTARTVLSVRAAKPAGTSLSMYTRCSCGFSEFHNPRVVFSPIHNLQVVDFA